MNCTDCTICYIRRRFVFGVYFCYFLFYVGSVWFFVFLNVAFCTSTVYILFLRWGSLSF